ncbi:MAG: hypothetical protein OXF88_14215 [Rhodobacteraceae bacterium]|nr:hypothetical protein [Paracoccaceae bacterium]
MKLLRDRLLSTVVAIAMGLSTGQAGGLTGVATEWTQLANNAQLAKLASIEASQLSVASETLATEVEQLRNLILAYRNMVANTERLPGSFHRKALEPIIDLRRLYMKTGIVTQSGQKLDQFMKSGQITDPLFDQEGYSRNDFEERYDALQTQWTSSLEAGLRKAGFTLADVETEAGFVDQLSRRAGQADGNLAALQVANELSASLSRQVLDLRLLQAAQVEQTAMAWSRRLQEQDIREAIQRRYDETLAIDLQAVEEYRPRGIHSILGLD